LKPDHGCPSAVNSVKPNRVVVRRETVLSLGMCAWVVGKAEESTGWFMDVK